MASKWLGPRARWDGGGKRGRLGSARPNYRPVVLKLPFLLCFAAYLCLLLGVLEWSCRRLPTSNEDQNVPEGPAPDGRIIMHTAPLVQARGTPTPTPTPPPMPNPTTGSTVAMPTSGSDTEQSATPSGWKKSSYEAYLDAPRPPAIFGGRTGYGPEYLHLLGLNQQNTSMGWNASVAANSTLSKRVPGKEQFAHLSGPIVGVTFELLPAGDPYWESDYMYTSLNDIQFGGTLIRFTDPGAFQAADCWNTGAETTAFGIVSCNGPLFAFHDEGCWLAWQKASQKQQELASQGNGQWDLFETTFWDPRLSRNEWTPERCPGPMLGKDYEEHRPNRSPQPFGEPTDIVVNNEHGIPVTTIPAYKASITTTGPNGLPTTSTRIQHADSKPLAGVTTITEFNAQGTPIVTYPAQLIIYTDADGKPYTTSTRRIPTSQTLVVQRNSDGIPYTTIPVDLPISRPTDNHPPLVVTKTNAQGEITAVVTVHPHLPKSPGASFSKPSGDDSSSGVYILSHSDYYLLLFLPVLCTVIVSILAEMVSYNLHILLPFQAMTQEGGASARDSLLFPRGILSGFIHAIRLARSGDPLSLLAQTMVIISALITALSSEAVGIGLGGSCKRDDFSGCFMEVAIFLPPARALQVLLGVDLGLVMAIMWLISRPEWVSGVAMMPGSVMATGAVAQSEDLRWLFRGIAGGGERGSVEEEMVLGRLRGWRFEMGDFQKWDKKGVGEYGVLPRAAEGRRLTLRSAGTGKGVKLYRSFTLASAATFKTIQRVPTHATRFLPPGWTPGRRTKEQISDCCALLFMWGLIILITYYNAIESPDTPFERFMNEQDFGVRVLFTAFGVLLTFFWDHYYTRIATQEPYRLLSRPQGAPLSTLTISPSTTVFVGYFTSLLRLEIFPSIVAFSDILSKFIPILLSNVPFSPIQTYELHMACAWTSVGSLSFISLVLVWGLVFVKYPVMPIDPASLAGQVYYLCDSDEILDEFSGMGRTGGKEGRRTVLKGKKGKRFGFGEVVGDSGFSGVGVFAKALDGKKA